MLKEIKEMKSLVVFYSKNAHTKIIAKKVAAALGADMEEIVDLKDRSAIATWAKSAFNEELRTPTEIQTPKADVKQYDIVIVGTPIWDGVTPAVRAYLASVKPKKVAFFATFGASAEDACYEMEQIVGKKALAMMEIQDLQISRKEDEPRIKEFCGKILRG